MDFRSTIAESTFRRTQDSSGDALVGLGESGCVLVPGGRRVQCLIEIPFLIFTFVAMVGVMAVGILSALNILPTRLRFILLSIGLAISLVSRWVKSLIMKPYLRLRSNSLLSAFKDLPLANVGIENWETRERIKMIPEDEGICVLDAERRRLLIEGCSYRYIVYARDVYSLTPASGYAMSGVRMTCRMAGEKIDVILKVRGHGPIASLVQTFSPQTGATKLSKRITQTLFGVDDTTYSQPALPPPLPFR